MDVSQHEYGITLDPKEELVTRGIWICTGWYGWDTENGVAFLCHLDHPLSPLSVLKILKEIRKNVPENHAFESCLVGGKWYFWSPLTRLFTKVLVWRQKHLNISVKCGGYDHLPWGKRAVHISSAPRKESFENRKGRTHPKGFLWFFGPIKKCSGSA